MAAKHTDIEKNPRGRELHRDPITGEPGAHPVGAGVGAAAGAVTGAAIGSAGGPIGTAVGTALGALAGGLVGKGIAETIDPSAEDAHWREHHSSQSYADPSKPYQDYAPAYRAGYTGYRHGKSFEEREAELRAEYEKGEPPSTQPQARPIRDPAMTPGTMPHHMSTYPLRWPEAREAARAAYERVSRGDAQGVQPPGGA